MFPTSSGYLVKLVFTKFRMLRVPISSKLFAQDLANSSGNKKIAFSRAYFYSHVLNASVLSINS